MKNPLKLTKKEFPKYGAVLLSEHGHGIQIWQMPWGQRWEASPRLRLHSVRAMLDELKRRGDELAGFLPGRAPVGVSIEASRHFADQFLLMSAQHGQLTHAEVRAALLEPTETRVHPHTGRLAYIRDRVAIIAAEEPTGGICLITALWTRPDLWAQNPRETKETTHV